MARPPVSMFVSSPADATAERDEIDRIVRKLNAQNKWRWPALQVIRWPEDILPGAGSDLQGVINQQVGEFDIFFGVMRTRFGTPTPRAGSGTEEELERALEQHQIGRHPIRIMLYFSNMPVRALELDPHQLLLVHSLKQRVESLGVLPFSYNDMDQFRRLAGSHVAHAYREAVTRSPLGKTTYSVNGALRPPAPERTIALGDFHFTDHIAFPQWADPKIIPIAAYQRNSWALKGSFSSRSAYYRIGFKLKEAREPNFGPGNIQTAGQNLLLHIGKNASSEEVFFTYYKSGIRLEQDRPFAKLGPDVSLALELSWSREGLLEFKADGTTLLQTFFSIDGIPQLIILGWGDEHKYESRFSDVTLTVSSDAALN